MEDFLNRLQRRAVRVVDAILIASLGLRGEDNHADRPVASLSLIPGDKDDPTLLKSGGIHNCGHIVRQPGIASGDAAIMHVVAEIRRNEIVTRGCIVLEVRG